MKYLTKHLRSALWMIILMVMVAITSSLATMVHVANLHQDNWKYMQLEQRWANWPAKECYNALEIELLITGPIKDE